jgi:hypothetical protein
MSKYNPSIKVKQNIPIPKPKTKKKQFAKLKFSSNIFLLPADNKGIRTFSPSFHRHSASLISNDNISIEPVSIRKNETKPSEETVKINDRKRLLPTEYYNKYNLTRNNSENNLCLSNKLVKRPSYPYNKDNIGVILKQSNRREDQVTSKVNNNPFDILRRVPKYEWEK